MKTILYIHHGKGIGGAPISLLQMVEGLDRAVYRPVVLFLYDSEVVELYRSRGVEIVGPINTHDFSHTRIWWYRWYHVHHLLKAAWSTLRTWWSIADYWYDRVQPDIVHLNTSSLIAWGAVAHRRNIPVVWHIREPLARGYLGLRRLVVRTVVQRCATVIMPICKHDGLPWKNNERMRVVYNAVDLTRFTPAVAQSASCHTLLAEKNLATGQQRILFLGGLSREKGTLLILQAFHRLLQRMPQAQLVIAGYFDVTLRPWWHIKAWLPSERYKRAVVQALAAVGESVVLVGPTHDVPCLLSSSQVLVFPATVGHFARPIIEASSMKIPVVAARLAPLDELVVDGVTGFLVDPARPDVWAEKLATILENDALQKSFGAAGADMVHRQFDLTKQLHEVQSSYEKI